MRENLTAELHINKPSSNCDNSNEDEEGLSASYSSTSSSSSSSSSSNEQSRVTIGEIGDDETALANMIEMLFKGKITVRNGPFPKEFITV